MTHHTLISPSALSRARLCPGSVRRTAPLPRRSNRAAAEGTMLHDIAADCLVHGFEPQDFLGQVREVEGFAFTLGYEEGETDPTCMAEGLDWLREQPGEMFVERRVGLDPWMPGQSGTMDVGLYTPELATVLDWKFGAGVLVRTEGNEQAQGYAVGFLGMIRELGLPVPPRWRIVIEQPRAPGGARYHQPWEIGLAELEAFTEVMAQIWAAASDPAAPRRAGEKQCYFCAAKDEPEGCPEHAGFLLDLAGLTFADLDVEPEREPELPEAGTITAERRSYLVRHGPMLRGWLERLHADTLVDALTGKPTPGLKAVAGRASPRFYSDPEGAEAVLTGVFAEGAFTKKLKSPAQVEKMMKPGRSRPGHPDAWERLQPLIGQTEGKPSLVPEEDPRPALTGAIDRFDNLDLGETEDE